MIVNFPIDMINKSRFHDFIQQMADRIMQGHFRYGNPNRRKNYVKRIELELKAYKENGNMEHLINIANYCHLETCEPWNKKFHFDSLAKSATRSED